MLSQAITFRGQILSAGGCSFCAEITADYGQEVHTFKLACDSDADGKVTFRVMEPDSIAEITGHMEGEEGAVTYDGLQLAFPLFVYDRVSPVAAPAIVVNCWLKAFILSAGASDGEYRVTYEKKIDEKVLLIDTYFEKNIPISADVCYNGSRIISLKISEFSC